MTTSTIKVAVHDESGTIILNRPERRNALSRQLLSDIREAFDDLHLQKKVRAVILTGSGSVFCAGTDLAEIRETARQDSAQTFWQHDANLYRGVLETMLRFPKPIISAVNGPAIATGGGLVLASDIVIGTPEASLSFPEPQRGLVGGSVAPLLMFRLGASRAANLLLSSREIDAMTAQEWGIYHEVIDQDRVWARARQWAKQCAKSAPQSLLMTKSLLNETIGEQVFTWLSAGAAASAAAKTTESAAEGVNAFFERRAPHWP